MRLLAKEYKFIRYLAVGAGSYTVDAACFYGLFLLTGNIVASNIISRSLGALVGYKANKIFTFQVTQISGLASPVKYVLLWAINTVISTQIIVVLLNDYFWIKLFTELAVMTTNFFIIKRWVFK